MTTPIRPKIYHIVHINNLASIVADGHLWSDAVMAERSSQTVIGIGRIKQRRLGLPVSCHLGISVGDCVPFYLCPRSIMLFKIHKANDPELAYQGGQQLVIHLEADLHSTVQWAEENGRCWAFSLSNASAVYTQFRSQLDQLHEINWAAVASTYWAASDIREGKQAEFLVEQSFPWHLVERIGIHSKAVAPRVAAALADVAHRPRLEVQQGWYY